VFGLEESTFGTNELKGPCENMGTLLEVISIET